MEDKNSNKNPLEDLFSSFKDYLDLRIDELKLILAENGAKILSKTIYFVLIFILTGIVLGFLAAALSSWLGMLLDDNKIAGMLLTAGLFVIIAIIVFLFRNKFLMNGYLRMFLKIFFNKNKKDEKE